MTKVIAGMTISLDGYINDQNGSVDKLYPDFAELHDVPSFKKMIQETGAVVMGRNVYEMADPFEWATDDYEFQTPIFVLTHTPPEKFPKGNGKLSFIFVADGIESAIAHAKKAANGKDVQVIGAQTIQECLNAGLCELLQVDIIPVLIGRGKKLFEHIDREKITLGRVKTEDLTSQRTSITFQVIKKLE